MACPQGKKVKLCEYSSSDEDDDLPYLKEDGVSVGVAGIF